MWNDFKNLLDDMGNKKEFNKKTLEKSLEKEIAMIVKGEN
jgi:hypothetical protein